MRNTLKFLIAGAFLLPWFAFSQTHEISAESQQLLGKPDRNFFIENKGQWPAEVKYMARIGGMNAWITNKGVVYDYYQIIRNYKPEETIKLPLHEKDEFERKHTGIRGQVINIELENANIEANNVPSGIKETYYNYFIGNDSTKWASFVPLYDEISLKNIYAGIDVRYYFDNGLVRYDYIAKPGADLAQIKLNIQGAEDYQINEKGELVIKTILGDISHGKLYAYQQNGKFKTEISCAFNLNQNGTIGILAENYNPALALVIDPLIYSSFMTGYYNQYGTSVAVDPNGYIVFTGYTLSNDYPVSSGVYDTSYNGNEDVFVTKLNASGYNLIFSTYIGGGGDEESESIVIDSDGYIYLAGSTGSGSIMSSYPTTSGAFDTTYGGYSDAFITKLNPTGSALIYSTLLGGWHNDFGHSISLDNYKCAYITGNTISPDFPTTSGAFSTIPNGATDIFVTKLNASGSALLYSTLIGCTDYECGRSIVVDSNGNAYITGENQGGIFPTTTNAFDVSFNGGNSDVFVTKLNSSGSALVFSTLIGGNSGEISASIALDCNNNVIITGTSGSVNFPTTSNTYNRTSGNIFVSKLNSTGTSLIFSTFIGYGYGNSITIDSAGASYILGSTNGGFPTTYGAFDNSHNGGSDITVTKLNSNGTSLIYSTFIGGSNEDFVFNSKAAIDSRGKLLITGYTKSSNFPTTAGAYNSNHNGYDDVFIISILPINQSTNITLSNVTDTQLTCSWTKGDGTKRAVFVKQVSTGLAFPINSVSYSANDTFGLGSQIGSTGWYCVYNDTGSSVIIKGLKYNKAYRIMVCDYIGNIGEQLYNTDSVMDNPKTMVTPYPTPNRQASNINFTSISNTSFILNFTKGNGTKRTIFIKQGNSGRASPENKTTYYASTSFGSGTQIGVSGWFCIYNDTGRTVTINNLSSNTFYRIMVCEYNGTSGLEQYNLDSVNNNPITQITNYPLPTIQASGLTFYYITSSSFSATWTNGNGSERVVFACIGNSGTAYPVNKTTYLAKDTFGLGSQLGSTGWYCVYKGTGNNLTLYGLSSNTYRLMVCEFNGVPGLEMYNQNTSSNNPANVTTLYPIPTQQASNITFSNITSNGFTITCTKGNGTKRAIFVKSGTTGNASPLHSTTYTPNTAFGSGTQISISGWYCVYNDGGESVTISNLNSNTAYRVMVCEYNGTPGVEQYKTDTASGNPVNQYSDYAVPNAQASYLTFNAVSSTSFTANWTNGNGAGRVVFVKATNTGSANPIDNSVYNANDTFGMGSQIGTSGWYCVYKGTSNSITIKGLAPNTIYRVMVCEFNGLSGKEKYNVTNTSNNPDNYYPAPTNQASSISFSNYGSNSFTASWTNGNGTARAAFICSGVAGSASPSNNTTYTANAVYGSGSQISSSGWYCVYNGTGNTVTITGLTANTNYRLMVCEYNGINSREQFTTSDVSNNPRTFYPIPSTQAYDIVFTNVGSNSMDISWDNGNGSKRVVFALQGNSGLASPSKYVTYTPSTVFGTGTQIGSTGWYCIYNGSGSNVTLNGLAGNTAYRIMVCEFNGLPGDETYNINNATNNPSSQTTDYSIPTNQASNISFSIVTSNSIDLSWTRGNGSSLAIFITQGNTGYVTPSLNTNYIASSIYGSGSQVGSSGWYCIYNSTGTNVSVSGLNPNTTYRIMACEYNGIGGKEKYNTSSSSNNPNNRTTDYAVPTIQAGNISFSSITDSSFTASWTNGNGSSRIVFIKKATSGSAIPVDNNTYSSSQKFGQGTQIGTSGWYCVYNSSGTSVNVNGLTANTSYQVMVCEYNGTSGLEKYNTSTATNNPKSATTDYAVPSTQAKDISFSAVTDSSFYVSWTNGGGTSRAVFIKATSTGTAAPASNTTYTANTVYGSGSQVGTTGWYCIYNGTGTSASVKGINPNTTYRVMVSEYNGTAGSEKYDVASETKNPNNQTTDFKAPNIQAYNITFSAVTDTSFTASWTLGNGMGRAVFIKAGVSGTAIPTDNSIYTANSKFGFGTQIGTSGWYCIYNSSGTSVNVNGLTANTSYQVMVCEYNGTSGWEKYNITTGTNNPNNKTSDYAIPTIQTKNITFSNVTATSLKASWTNGNGSSRIAFIKAGTTGTVSPVNNTTYSPDTFYSYGTQLSGWYCVYKGTESKVTIAGLNPNTPYCIMVCECNGTNGYEKYNTTSNTDNPKSKSTDYTSPSVQAYNLSFYNITDSSLSINWLPGNGSSRAVFMKMTISGNAVPVNNFSYSSDTAFGSGSQIGNSGWYCIYNGAGNKVEVTGLFPSTAYRVMISEYNGTSGVEKYNTNTSTNNPMNQTTDYMTPDVQSHTLKSTSILANSFTLSWSRGNGSRSIVFIKSGSSGTATPDNNTTYTANSYFGSGSMIGSSGWYCVYNGFDTFVSVSGLAPNATYRLMVCEYNGLSGSEKYNTNTAKDNPVNVLTDFIAPTIQSSAIQIADNSPNKIKISWSRGNGSSCIAFIKGTTIGSGAPINNASYTPDTVFGLGSQLGTSGWFCFYKGTGNDATIYGLISNKNYRIMICEYNGTPGKEKYKTDPAFDNPLNSLTLPGIFSLSGGGAYCADKILTGIKVTLDSTETGVTYQLLKNTAPLGTPINGNNNSYTWNDQTKGLYTVEASNASGSILMNRSILVIENPLPEPEINGLDNEYCLEFPAATLTGIPAGGTFSGKGISGVAFNPASAGTGKHKIYYTYTDMKGCKNTDSNEVSVHKLEVEVKPISVSCGQPALLDAIVNYTGTADSFIYKWLPEEGLDNPNIKNPIAHVSAPVTYEVSVSSHIGCKAGDTGLVTIVPLSSPEICVVTIDTVTWKNKVIWTKPFTKGSIEGFKIYKESEYNIYEPLTTIPYENSPQIIDMSSMPEKVGTKYKVSVIDTCGLESELSFYHKTINLTLSAFGSTMGLNWDNYVDESGKYVPPKYYIYRGTTPSNLHLYDSVSGSFHSYNDINIFSVYYYMVGVIRESCNDTSGEASKIYAFSNKKDNSDIIPRPEIQASDIRFYNITSNSVSYDFTKGDGYARVVLVIDNDTASIPVLNDNTTYTDTSKFGTTNWKCIYNGVENKGEIKGLVPGAYQMMVYEYNGTPGFEKYNTQKAYKNPNTISLLSIAEEGSYSFIIYPNPFKEITTVRVDDSYASQGYSYTLHDCTGKTLIHRTNQTATEFIIEKGELKKGIYFIEISGVAKLRGKLVIVD